MDFLKTHTIHETARTFSISIKAICSWKKLVKETGSLKRKPSIRKPRKINYDKLMDYIEQNPDKYLREIAEVFGVSICGIHYALKKMKISLKKRSKYIGGGMRKNVRIIRKKYLDMSRKI